MNTVQSGGGGNFQGGQKLGGLDLWEVRQLRFEFSRQNVNCV